MKQLLFMGDSLTAGNLGSSYLALLGEYPEFQDCTLLNEGEDGYTIEGIRTKMESLPESRSLPDVLILEGGANDLLLPFMQSAGNAWDPFIRKLKRHGSVPLETEELFREGFGKLLSSAFDRGIKRVVTCTIPCLGEDLSSPLNRKREVYNRVIRDVTAEYQKALFSCDCADPALAFEKMLNPFQPGSDYLFRTPADLQTDAERIHREGEESLCLERNLRLTIDGAHPNRSGAAAVAGVFREILIPVLS